MKRAKVALGLILLSGLGLGLAATPANTYVIMGFGDPVPDFDPTQAYDSDSAGVLVNIYESLYTYKGSSIKDFEPLLAAEMPKITNGGKTFTITLRKNVKFHSGNPFTCEDAEYTFERALVTANAESWAGTIIGPSLVGSGDNANDDKNVTWAKIDKSVECNAQGQLVFNLVRPDGSFLSKLAFKDTGIIDKKFAAGLGEWSGTEKDWKDWIGKSLKQSALQNKESGTGAYTLVSKSPTQYVYKAFDGYWGGKPKIENVIDRRVPEEATRILAIQRGDADRVILGQRSSLEQLKNSAGVVILDDLPSVSQNAVFLNQAIKGTDALGSGKLDGKGIPANFFTDINVRKGFQYAFNYKQYIDQVLVGKGKMRTMPLPETFFGYDPKLPVPEYNLEKATQYFKKAWGGQVWQNGFTMPIVYNTGNLTRQSVAEILKANLEKINPKFKVDVQGKPFGEVNTAASQGRLAIRIGGWGADYADPDNFLPVFLSSTGFYSPGLNFKDSVVDNALVQAASTTDQAKRAALYKVAARRAYDLAPLIVLPANVPFEVVRQELKGFTKDAYNPMLSNAYVLWKDLSK